MKMKSNYETAEMTPAEIRPDTRSASSEDGRCVSTNPSDADQQDDLDMARRYSFGSHKPRVYMR